MSKINITVQLTNNDNIVKFVTKSFITQSKSYEFNNIDDAKESPIAQRLFHLPFVKTIYISQNFIAIEKFPFNLTQVKWQDVQDEVAESISDYFKSGQPVINKKDNESSKKNPITIYAESTPNPEVLKFVANRTLANTMYEFKNKNETVFAPLANELFNFPFVKEVFMNTNYISITKKNNYTWQEFSNELREFIRNYIEDNKTIFKDEILQKQEQTNQLTEDRDYSEIEKEIISILNEYIRPAVEGDGGNIAFDSYNIDTKTVKVILQGACSGCPSSTVTLKNGIENMLREMLNGKVEYVEALNE
ncbi:NifU family protein [Flavobacteriaceae bacterium]|jgi:Fe-S cluster biogenesis protein NfuA|nr:NifU family protein [Flavobacteriaceae bacterium]MDB4590296.1 NifU family protein [Flavobacteriaceae bacterium]MDC6468185.1 NifU family protein [Flavobacteriaceae bacterium]|tara:strand:+ start:9631 stop:10545 length:915 start_codon:yes stop_codon:yes gene_type:complete